jgi:RpiR family carbohydrate utilization transcriptional regulator
MLLDSIRTQLDSLSKSEKKVALAVLTSPTRRSARTSRRWRKAQVSEPTVVRFAAPWAMTAGMSSS